VSDVLPVLPLRHHEVVRGMREIWRRVVVHNRPLNVLGALVYEHRATRGLVVIVLFVQRLRRGVGCEDVLGECA
jgi:hypothetical protein